MKTKAELLAGQALDTIVPYTWTKLDYEQIHELLAYHAELIIFECTKIAVFKGDKETAVAIKENFGVK
jgi:hypothetical protein